MSDERIMRVTVRGRFVELNPRATEYLRANQPEDDVSNSAYTPEGTLTYDAAIDYFSMRFEIRLAPMTPMGWPPIGESTRRSTSSGPWDSTIVPSRSR